MTRETRRITLDVDTDTLATLDNLKEEGDFKSRSKLLNFILPTALARLDDAMVATEAQISTETARLETSLQEGETEYEHQYTADIKRLIQYDESDKVSYAGFTQGDDVTLFFQNPREGFIARIWKTRYGYRFVILFSENAYAVLTPAQLQKAIHAAKEAKRVKARRQALQNAA